MSVQKPIVIDQAELAWEDCEDADLATKSAIRWKLLVTGERGPSSGLVMGISECPPGGRFPLHHHEPEETYYVVSGHGTDGDRRSRIGDWTRFGDLHPVQCETCCPLHQH